MLHLQCDLTQIPRSNYEMHGKRPEYIKFWVTVELTVTTENATVRVMSGGVELAKEKMLLAKEPPPLPPTRPERGD